MTDSNPNFDIELSDGKNNRRYGLILDGRGSIQESSVSSETFGAYFREVGKKFGDFDEQRTWKGGRGNEYLSDNPEGYYDSENCWTLTPGHVVPTLQWSFAKDLRSCDFNMPGDVTWKSIFGTERYLSVSFAASASYTSDYIWLWIRRRGRPSTLTMELCSDDGGDPGTVLETVTKSVTNVTDTVSILMLFNPSGTRNLTSGTTYHIKMYGASPDDKTNHWDVACDTSAGGKKSSDNTTWTATGYSPYYRITDADVHRIWYMWIFDGLMYVCDNKDSGSASVLYMNGDRGKATSSTSTTIVDTGKTWTTNMWAGARVKIIRGTGAGQSREIVSNDATGLTVSTLDITGSTDSEYIIYSTDRFTQITGHGLGRVKSCPIVANSIMYFPQGSTAIRRIRWNAATPAHEFAADSTNTADFLVAAQDPTDGLQVWRGLNSTMSVARASVAAWNTDLVFGTAIAVGENNFSITGMNVHEGQVYVFKENALWQVSSDRATVINIGIEATPSKYNGYASASHQLSIYMSWLWSVNRLYGGVVDDVGQDWRSGGLPQGREGSICKLEPAAGWLFAGIDAGPATASPSNEKQFISSVLCWDGFGWHEILRGYYPGMRIQNVKWQACEDARHRLWTSIEGDLVYQVFPLNKASPILDTSIEYQHEGVLTSSIIDMGAASSLPKYIRGLTATTKGLTSGVQVDVDYQVDDDIDTSTWTNAPSFVISPEQEIEINEGDIRQFRYRLRLNTNDATVAPDVKGIVPNGFARVPWRKVWHVRIKAGLIQDLAGRRNMKPDKFLAWLDDVARFPGRVFMTSDKYPTMDKKWVVISPPTMTPLTPQTPDIDPTSSIMINLMEA